MVTKSRLRAAARGRLAYLPSAPAFSTLGPQWTGGPRLARLASMKASIIRAFGGVDQFELADMPKPVPGPKQVLVRVAAASVNPVDYKIRQSGAWSGLPLPGIIGYDAAGVVEAVGDQTTRLKVGDEVFYSARIFGRQGTYAEYHIEDEEIVALKPPSLSWQEAAAIPLAGITAYDSVISFFHSKPGDTVLVHAGAGGVGHFAVQLAKAAGARVLATGRAANTELIKSLGADEVIDYQNTDFADEALRLTEGRGVDAAFDTVGGTTVSRSIKAVRPYGKLATVVSIDGSLNGMQAKNLTLYFGFMERTEAKIHAMATLVSRRQLHPLIDSVFPLDQIAAAHTKLEAGGIRGKVVIRI